MAYVDSSKLKEAILKYQQDGQFTNELYTILKYVLDQTQRYFYFKDTDLRNDCCSGGMEGMFVALKNYKTSKKCKIIDVDFDNGKVIIQTRRLKKSIVQNDDDDDDEEEVDEELDEETVEADTETDVDVDADVDADTENTEDSDSEHDYTNKKEYVSVAYKIEKTIMTEEQQRLYDARDRDGFIATGIIEGYNNAFSYMMSACRTGFSKVYRVFYPTKRVPTCSLNAILENSGQISSFDDYDD